MDKARRKKLNRAIAALCAVAVVLLLAALPLLADGNEAQDAPQASILSGTAETGSISSQLIGGGTLEEEASVTISVPSAVKLTGYLVSNGDPVKEGDPIASVDRVTVMAAIAEVQETLDHLSEEIEAERKEETSSKVTAQAGGTVKLLYAQEGGVVQDIMLEHGALAVLSLDGLMAAELETTSELPAGSIVTVTLSDGTEVSGRVESNLLGTMVVTLEDDGYAVGESVQVAAADGTGIGSGELYIHNSWNATAYAGTVDSIRVREGDEVDTGDLLMVLADTGNTAAYQQLVDQRAQYEELMLELFEMYQTEVIAAPCDGIVSGLDEDSPQLLASGDEGYVITFLVNSPSGDDETLYTNYLGQITAVAENGWAVKIAPQGMEIADYKDLSGISLDTSAMTQVMLYTETDAPVYELEGENWVQADAASVAAGDVMLFAVNPDGAYVWCVRVQRAASDPEPSEPAGPDAEPSQPNEPAAPSTPSAPDAEQPGGTLPSSGGSWGNMGGQPQTGPAEQEPEYELYDMEVKQIAAVTPQDTMTLNISIDELDITRLQLGQTATVVIDALGGESVSGAITDISNTGTNNGGNSKFTVELTVARSESMLPGMNASASITLDTASDVLSIPVAALVEAGSQTVVYTGYDEESGVLTDPVAVTVGLSDGENAEILDGLSAGTTYYYAYYDTLEISFAPDFGSGKFPFG